MAGMIAYFAMSHPNPYHLFLSQRSPFARRIRLALRRLELPFEMRTLDVFGDHPEFLALNPLGMVPTLKTPEGVALCDSSAILEYLHEVRGEIWPRDFGNRIRIRQASTLVTGMIQSAVALYQESAMHEVPSRFWVKDHEETIVRTRTRILELSSDCWVQNGSLTQAGWDLAVAIEYLELRVGHLAISSDHAIHSFVMKIAEKHEEFRSSKPTPVKGS